MNMKKIWIGALCAVLTVFCVIGGFLLSGHFEKTEAPQTETTAAQTTLAIKPMPVGQKAELPQSIRGTTLFAAKYISTAFNGTDKVIASIKNAGFNAVLLRPDSSDPAFGIKDLSDALASLVSDLRAAGLYTSLAVDFDSPDQIADFAAKPGADGLVLSGIFDKSKTLSLDQLKQTAAGIEDALSDSIVSSVFWDLPFTAMRNPENAAFLSAFSKVLRDSQCTGVCTSSDVCGESFSGNADYWLSFCSDKPLWFLLADSASGTETGFMRMEKPFRQVSMLIGLETTDTPVSYFFGEYDSFSDDESCLSLVRNCVQNGIVPDSYLKSFKITNYNSTAITTNESKITFIGESNPAYALQCNGAAVRVTEDGFFSAEYPLKVGKNTFTFSENGKKYPYTVQYNMDLIRSISPSGSLNTPGGNALEVYVVAHRNANVTAKLGGSSIKMTSSGALLTGGDNGHMDTSSDYVTYIGKYNLPAGKSSNVLIGTIQANASYQGVSDSITGARVTVTAEQKIEALPVVTPVTSSSSSSAKTTTTSTTATSATLSSTSVTGTTSPETETTDAAESESSSDQTSSSKSSSTSSTSTSTSASTSTTSSSSSSSGKLDPVITPYSYNGLPGTKRMCKIKTYYTETMPLSPLNDLSVPLSTPLLTGTFDFITGESSFDKYTYYNLGSGRRVYRKDVEVIEKGYAMPANTLTVVSSGTSGGKTNIRLHLTWKVPFNAVLNGQRYVNDPRNKREYAVTSLNAKSLDITFYYSANAVGQPNVSGSGVISSCEWVKSASPQTCTLRLYLRNASRFYGYSFSYNSDDTLQLSIKEKGADSVSGKTVMLDPGHGGKDGGASCAVNSSTYNEAKIALTISEKVRDKLRNMGADVVMTRTSNIDLTLDARKRMARQNSPDIFVSIHMDAAASSSGYGTTGFYYRPYSYALAKSIHTQLVSAYVKSIYGTQKSSIDRGTVFYPFSVTRIEECPSVLIECGFVSNLEECKILQNSKHQDTIATAIANGIRDYFASN